MKKTRLVTEDIELNVSYIDIDELITKLVRLKERIVKLQGINIRIDYSFYPEDGLYWQVEYKIKKTNEEIEQERLDEYEKLSVTLKEREDMYLKLKKEFEGEER